MPTLKAAPNMKTITAREAKNRFGKLLDEAQREPVTVTKQGRPFAVVISANSFDKDAYDRALRDKLLAMLKESQKEATRNGMTEEVLADLLKDES